MEDNNSYIEKYIKDFTKSKTRIFTTLFSIISVIFALLFMTENKLNAITTIYAICMLCAGIAAVIYTSDIYNKNKYCNDILVCGLALNLTGVLLRVIKLGIVFSIRYFIGYCAFACVIILMIIKLSKNKIKEKPIIIFSVIMTLYCLFEFFYTNMLFVNGFTAAMYRISEAALLLTYISILIMNKADYQAFSEKVGNYKTQIPSLKICLGIFAIIAVTAIGIGTVKNIDKIHFNSSTIEKSEKTEKTENKVDSDKTEKNETITSTKGQNEAGSETEPTVSPTKEPTPTISLGETVSTDNFDFTLNKVELTYEVKPENTNGVYSSYQAESGKIYVHIDGSYYNKSNKDVCVRDLFVPSAEYDNNYSYEGFAAVDDGNSFTWASSYIVCTPLETCHYHGIIECPEVVGNTDNSLKVKLKIGDTLYEYTVR